jgi:segregation and condensation protein B
MTDLDNKVKMIVEGLLLAAGRPLTLDNIALVFNEKERPDSKELKAVMHVISEECNDRGFELKEVASGYRFQVKQELSGWIAKLWEEKSPRYTRALLETLALIVYRQPITRGDIEEIRGVGVSPNIIRTLLDREWVRVVGHRDVPGRPAMFATTKRFLDYFNLKSLQELPPLSEIKDLDKSGQEIGLDDLVTRRILELPEEAFDENSYEPTAVDDDELLAEKEAIELSKKPLDEILGIGLSEELHESEEILGVEETETESTSFAAAGVSDTSETPVKKGKEDKSSLEAADDEVAADQGSTLAKHEDNDLENELDTGNEEIQFVSKESIDKFEL